MERFHALCYTSVMFHIRYPLMVTILLVASGCALLREQTDQDTSSSPQITYVQVKAAPESYNGHPVTFGGKVLGARRIKEGTRIEILQLPLTKSLRPTMELSKSQGRFVALQTEFLDPATIPPGTFVTVTGEMAGSITMPLDEMEYTYPFVRISNLRVWIKDDEELPRTRRPIGSYWDPYWEPYGHSWPYY